MLVDVAKTSAIPQIPKCLKKFQEVFGDDLKGGSLITVKTVIETTSEEPVYRQAYNMSQLELNELRKQIAECLEIGFIEPSESAWSSPILFAKKKDGSLRMCVDYRALIEVTKKARYPIPRMDKVLEQTNKASIFSKIDLKSGYHQLLLEENKKPKTSFNT